VSDKIDTSPEAVEVLAEVLDSRRRSNTGYDIKRGAETLLALSARVTELEAGKEKLRGAFSCAAMWQARAEAAEVRFIEQRDNLVSVTKKLAKTEAAIPRVYKMGLDAAAKACTTIIRDYDIMDSKGTKYLPLKTQKAAKSMVSLARQDIRDLTPPADLVQQATKGGE